MKMKKYRASTMPEAMKKVRAELGEQAVVLESKTVFTGGFFGLFKKKQVEVVAAADPSQSAAPARVMPPKSVPPAAAREQASPQPAAPIQKELNEMKRLLQEINQPADGIYPAAIQPVMVHLKEQNLAKTLLHETGQHVLKRWTEDSKAGTETIKKWVIDFLAGKLPEVNSPRAKYVYLLGPTGVGKTTTLAKLSSRQVMNEKKRVAFVTADTYRVAAIEQLRTYAALLNAPIKVAYSYKDMQLILTDLARYDVIFIDTAGRNFREEQYVKELQPFVQKTNRESAYFLVLSAAAKEDDLHDIIHNFSSIDLTGFIFTKIDETKTKGPMINLMIEHKLGVAYATNGQNVPDDLLVMDRTATAALLFEDFRHE